jgi:hypothetical protein
MSILRLRCAPGRALVTLDYRCREPVLDHGQERPVRDTPAHTAHQLRVWIPKSNGGQRPLGIPCIRDRVVEMAALLVLGPIFEADLLRNQYGFRPGMDAKMAVRQAFWHVSDHGRTEVVDADLSDYFSSIPHGPLTTMRQLMTRLGLTVNEAKTRLVRLPGENFDFLGYSIGRFHGKEGVPYIGTRPSRKAIRRLLQRIHDATRRSGQAGTGYRQYPDEYLYETLGLYALPRSRTDLPSAKA